MRRGRWAAVPSDRRRPQWMRVRLAESKRRVNVNNLWIASIALANDLTIYTQDHDYQPLAELGELHVVTV